MRNIIKELGMGFGLFIVLLLTVGSLSCIVSSTYIQGMAKLFLSCVVLVLTTCLIGLLIPKEKLERFDEIF